MLDAEAGEIARYRKPLIACALGLGAVVLAAATVWPNILSHEIAVATGLIAVGLAAWAVFGKEATQTPAAASPAALRPESWFKAFTVLNGLNAIDGVAFCFRHADGGMAVFGRDARRLLGLAPGEHPKGAKCGAAIQSEDRDRIETARAAFERSDATQAMDRIEYRLRDAGGEGDTWVGETRTRLPENQALIIARDVTQERAFATRAELASLMVDGARRGRVAFLANIDHEFRTPLNTIIGFSEIIQGQVLGPIGNERYAGYIGDIHASGRLLLSLVDSLLDLARAETGTLALHEENVDLVTLIAECGQLMRQAADRASVKLMVDCPPRLPRMFVDPHKLKRAILVLLDNAIKFTLSGGSITVAAALADDGGIALSIADDGVGIAPADIQNLLDATPPKHGQKAGLGLPLAGRLVELHGGRLSIVSGNGRGTVVGISLPAFRVIAATATDAGPKALAPQSASVATPPSMPGQRRILCIDPDPVVPRAIRQSLRAAGDRSEVLWRDTSTAGLAAAAALKPDVVLLDWHLPEVGGKTLADAIRDEPGAAETPMVFLADIEVDRQVERSLGGPTGQWLAKNDLTAANVKAALAAAMSKGRVRDVARSSERIA